MKRLSWGAFVILTSLFIASCSKEVNVDTVVDDKIDDTVYEYTFAIGKTNQNIVDTKATFDSDVTGLFLKWQTGDYLTTITNSTGASSGYSYSQSTVNASNDPVTFTIKSYKVLNKDDMVYCASPYISNPGNNPAAVTFSIKTSQEQDGDTFDATAMPIVAVPFPISAAITTSNGTNEESAVSFYNLGSVIEFDVFSPNGTYAGEQIQSITFTTSEATDYIGGSFPFNMTGVSESDASTLSISGYTETTITVSLEAALTVAAEDVDKDNAEVVYMVVAPGTHSGVVKVITNKATYTYTVPSRAFNRASVRRFGLNLEKAGARKSLPSFEKYTTQYPETGKYILVDKDIALVATGSLTSGKKMDVASITANGDGTITCPEAYILDITKISDGVYSIVNSAGEYIAWDSSTDFSLAANASSDKAQWIINVGQTGDKQVTIANVNTTDREIHLSSGNFRPVTSGGTKPLLYSLIDTRILESITISGGTREFYQNDVFNYDGLEVTAHFDDESSSIVTPTSVSTPDLSTLGSKTVTVAYTFKGVEKTTTYSITVVARPTFSVTLNDNGKILTEASVGAGVELPTRSNSGDYTFEGWSETELTVSTAVAPTLLTGTYYPTSNVTLYPVYSTSSEVDGTPTYNITTSLSAGKVYVFGAVKAAASASLAYNTTIGAINFTSTASWGSYVNITPSSEGKITTTVADACKWTLVSISEGAVVLKNSANKYFWVKTGTGASSTGVQNSSYTVYLEDASSTCRDSFLIHPTSVTNTNRLMLNTGNSYGYRIYGSSTNASGTMCPYIRFFEETPTKIVTTTYISSID